MSCDRAAYYILLGQYDRALGQLRGAAAGGSTSAGNENLRGLAVMMEGDVKQALAIFEAALEKEPAHPELRFNHAVALLKLAQFKRAASEFADIANADSGALRAAAAYHAALAVDRAGRTADAEAWLNQALALDPSFDAARLHLGTLLEKRGDLEGAAKAYYEVVRRQPALTAAMLRFGVLAQRAGRVEVGRTYLQQVIQRAPDSAEATEARKFLVMWE